MLAPLREQFPRLKKIWGDSHYGGTLIAWAKEHLDWEIEPVKPLKPSLPEKISPAQIIAQWERFFPGPSQLRAKRWVVERTIAWIVRCRRLARDFEGLPSSSEAFIQIAMSRLMLSRLAPAFP
jgi:Transposase DDE domain